MKHGTHHAYGKLGCRCAICKKFRSDYMREQRAKQVAGGAPEHVHGTRYGYSYYKCRCVACKEATADYTRTRGKPTKWQALRMVLRAEYIKSCKAGKPCNRWTAEQVAKIGDVDVEFIRRWSEGSNDKNPRAPGRLIYHSVYDEIFYEEG